MTELHWISATEALDRFARKELSPVELLDAVLARAEVVEPSINAFTEQLRDEAYAAARESERRYAGGGDVRPRGGIPLVLKEEQPIAGRTLEEGSLVEKGVVAELTHPVADRVLAAGAVVHARTTTPEFSCAPFTHTELWGVTRNPWNLAMSPGGSSGGSGASLAAGSTVLATGSDIGGSIRLPSSFCGVVGFKPPFGRVPGLAPFNQDTYCADGPMGRTVADDESLWALAVSVSALLEGLCLQRQIDPERTPDLPIGRAGDRWSLFAAASEALLLTYTEPADGDSDEQLLTAAR